MPGSILCVTYDTTTGRYLVQKAGSAQIADGAITSGLLASGIVGTVHLADGAVTSAKIASGYTTPVGDESVTSAKLASGAVIGDRIAYAGIFSGKIASGAVGAPALLANAIITSAKVASGIIAGVHIKDGSILSGELGSGIVGDTLLKDFGLLSGKYASGSITEQALVSGISIDISEVGQEPSYRAGALISAFLGVQFSTSGYFNHAQAADVDTMPAVGLAIANIASAAIGTFQYQGRITNPSWDFSGHIGELLFLGTSSQVTLTAPSTSGKCVQRVGKVVGPTIAFLRPELQFVQIAE